MLVNKIENILSYSQGGSELDSVSQSRIDIQESAIQALATTLEKRYPEVTLFEVSVETGAEIYESV